MCFKLPRICCYSLRSIEIELRPICIIIVSTHTGITYCYIAVALAIVQDSCCPSCKQPSEAHVLCFTHQQGSLTINVKRLSSFKVPGEGDGKIWMWHRCLKCSQIDGIPPSTRRVVMSDSAWGLSFGKFLELSFSNHATANRIAGCGHSLQKDCLRYYGYFFFYIFIFKF